MTRALLCAAATIAVAGPVFAQNPATDTSEYKAIIEAAKAEGKVVVYAPIDAPAFRPFAEDFESLYPGVKIEFTDMQTTALYNRYLSEMAAQADSADIIWNTPMDLQFKLVQDGYAETYASVEKPNLPAWGNWQDQLYAITVDPGVFVYNKNILKGDQVPTSHAALVEVMEKYPEVFYGRIVSYDIQKAAGGFLMATEDEKHFPDFWRIPELFGKVRAQFPTGSGFMIESVGSGESVLGYNQLGSYAEKQAKSNPTIGVIYPSDFIVLQSRTAFISKAARHPNAAKLMFDYMLSQRGQTILADQVGAVSLRDDVDGDSTLKALRTKIDENTLKPINLNPSLLEYLDPEKRTAFLARWQQGLSGRN